MSVESVKAYFKENNFPCDIMEMDQTTETVETAARVLGVEPALIAKTLGFKLRDRFILVVTKGDARIDNQKFKHCFPGKSRMMRPGEVVEITGHPVGGVCPFGLKQKIDIYVDKSLNQFDIVYPAAGSRNSCIKITPDELYRITGGKWVDVCG
ncbi:MAG: YbaK/EbsC family protein [Desulfobacterales bacterium]|nr:YbaK/EbsC family protein [Desulfobacterales bacterium]MDD4073411.1 YbaK/EbsC family protein [Desulfobacterales bacterium]MDD4391583.1 YbaK/EbsC family protein [Desulfobacterales bacterium]